VCADDGWVNRGSRALFTALDLQLRALRVGQREGPAIGSVSSEADTRERTPPLSNGDPVGRACLIVLGDIGRSPRMMAHAESLLRHGFEVWLAGFFHTPPAVFLTDHPRFHPVPLADRFGCGPRGSGRDWSMGSALLRQIGLGLELARSLLLLPRPDIFIAQNPPTHPSLPVALLVARTRRVRLVVDWHNFGHDMAVLRLGTRGPIWRALRALERLLGRGADGHLAVTEALARFLRESWGLDRVAVLPDLARWGMAPRALPERRELFERITGVRIETSTALLASSSSYSLDEDLDMLVDALVRYEARVRARRGGPTGLALPPVAMVISGQGPGRARLEERIASLDLEFVRIQMVFVRLTVYPDLLASADLGLCLHRSASGLDFPMKIVDMHASNLPVLAFDYGPVLRDRLVPGQNALLFDSAATLADRLAAVLEGFPASGSALALMRGSVTRTNTAGWEEAWHDTVFERWLSPTGS